MTTQLKINGNATEAEVSAYLVKRIITGDRVAEAEMVSRYQRGLKAVLFQKTNDSFVLEDVIQDTWLVVLKRVRNNELRDSSKLAGFIIQTGKNQLIMKFRKVRAGDENLGDELPDLVDKSLTPDQEAENTQLAGVISGVFSQMKQTRDQDLLERFYLSGDTKSDLCEEYDLTASHFDRVIFRARQRFKTLWDSRKETFDNKKNK